MSQVVLVISHGYVSLIHCVGHFNWNWPCPRWDGECQTVFFQGYSHSNTLKGSNLIALNVDIPDPTKLLEAKMDAITRFTHVMEPIQNLYQLPPTSIHIFYDLAGSTVAFNHNSSIFVNLRYYEELRMCHFLFLCHTCSLGFNRWPQSKEWRFCWRLYLMVTDLLFLNISNPFVHRNWLGIFPWHIKLPTTWSNLIIQNMSSTFHQSVRDSCQSLWNLYPGRKHLTDNSLSTHHGILVSHSIQFIIVICNQVIYYWNKLWFFPPCPCVSVWGILQH